MKVGVVAIARNENRYLKEWIDHYLSIGVDHIIIGDNNDIENGENILEFIKSIRYEEYVTVIDIRKTHKDHINVQNNFYTDAYNRFKYEYDYLAFFDIDEFLYFSNEWSPSNNIKEYIENTTKRAHDFYNIDHIDQIRVGWVVYGDNDQLFYDERPVQERFKYPSSKIYQYDPNNNVCGKTILKSSERTDLYFDNPHVAISNTNQIMTVYNGGSDYIQHTSPDPNTYFTHQDAVLQHYITKSTEEFFQRKVKDVNSYIHRLYDNDDPIRYFTKYYFTINERTPQKERLIEYMIKANF